MSILSDTRLKLIFDLPLKNIKYIFETQEPTVIVGLNIMRGPTLDFPLPIHIDYSLTLVS
jgi:hypothetical protein